jgi:hypothetical protein
MGFVHFGTFLTMETQDMIPDILPEANFRATFMFIVMSLSSWQLDGNKFPQLFITVATSSAATMDPWKFHHFTALYRLTITCNCAELQPCHIRTHLPFSNNYSYS